MAVTGGYTPISDKPTSSGDLETWNDSSELSLSCSGRHACGWSWMFNTFQYHVPSM